MVADRTIDDLVKATMRLTEFPLSGREVEELSAEGVREIILRPYHIAHRVTGDVVEILKVWHGKQMLNCDRAKTWGVQHGGGCGKMGQMPLPVSNGSPHIRIQECVVGER